MTKVFYIDDSKKGAKELLDYLRSLDFVKEDDGLTDEQYKILEKRKTNYLNGKSKTFSLQEVEAFIRKDPK